jgi:hypothetical protein
LGFVQSAVRTAGVNERGALFVYLFIRYVTI